jgi:hypothetical protein
MNLKPPQERKVRFLWKQEIKESVPGQYASILVTKLRFINEAKRTLCCPAGTSYTHTPATSRYLTVKVDGSYRNTLIFVNNEI